MPILSISYFLESEGRDIHLLRGERSRDLRVDSLWFEKVDGNEQEAKRYLDLHTDVKLEFRPTFKVAGETENECSGFGIRVSKITGEVSFDAGPAPDPAPANFIIEALIRENADGKIFPELEPARIRVHVHAAATRMWLTPARLTVRRRTAADAENTNYGFTVRVEFSDGTVGDLTANHNVTWGPAGNVGTGLWEGTVRIPAGIEPGRELPIEARFGGLIASAKMVVAAPWASDPAMPKAELVEGHPDTWAGTINPEVVPNVLIFGDGFFSDADQDAFRWITGKVVQDLKTDPLTRPFDRLATSMNYWRVVVPSTKRGISVRCEVFSKQEGGRLVARIVPTAVAPPADGPWNVNHLIDAVGLPMPTDVPPTEAIDPARCSALRDRWAETIRPDLAPPPAKLSDAVIDQWARMGTRTFIDEIDAFPALQLGKLPSLREDGDYPFLGLSLYRGGQHVLDDFYRALAAKNNVRIGGSGPGDNLGVVWADNRPSFRFNNRSLVVMLAAFKGGRSQADRFSIYMPLQDGNLPIPVIRASDGRKALEIDPTIAPYSKIDRALWRVMAHELGHAFGLGDEYVELPGNYTNAESDHGNLTSEPAVTDEGSFRAERIKWNWRRVRKAAVLREQIAPPAVNNFEILEIKVLLGQAFQFVAGDKVRLRKRAWREVLKRDPRELPNVLEVVSYNATGDVLTVRGNPTVLDLADFSEGSIVYVPVPMPDGSAGEARLVAPKIAKYIDDNNRPLTPWPCDPAAQLGKDARGNDLGTLNQVPAFDLFAASWSHHNAVRVVGLYSGGERLGCGVFHPTGSCMMRSLYSADTRGFCAVCRFVLVDLIDPQKHFWIDRDYDMIYPA